MKKLSKEKKLAGTVVELSAELKSVKDERERFRSVLNQIQQALNPGGSTYSNRVPFEDMPKMVWEMIWFRKFFEGRIMPERDHVVSLEKILRWVINPETAKDDERMARFEEEMKRTRGY